MLSCRTTLVVCGYEIGWFPDMQCSSFCVCVELNWSSLDSQSGRLGLKMDVTASKVPAADLTSAVTRWPRATGATQRPVSHAGNATTCNQSDDNRTSDALLRCLY